MSTVIGYARSLLPARPGERRLAIILYGLLTLMVLSDWVGKVGADSLFVKRFGVQYIPAMYILTPIAMLATSALLFAVVDRMRHRALFLYYCAFVMLASLAIQAALPLGGLIFPIAYVFAHGVKETIYLLFWVYAGNLYDTEQSERLFPFFAGAVLVGKILGGIVATRLADLIHAESFIGAQAVGFLACLVVIALCWNQLPEGRGAQAASPDRPKGLRASVQDSIEGYRTVAADHLMRTFGVGVFLWYLLMQIGNYLYLVGLDVSSVLGSARSSEDAFSQLYAGVYTSSSIVALLVETFATAGLVRRFGVSVMLFVFPLWYLGAFGGALVAFSFLTSVAIQLGERIVVPAVHRPVTELVYGQVSSAIRPRSRTFLSGGVNALGNLAAALLLLGAGVVGLGVSVILAGCTVLSVWFVSNTWSVRRTLRRRILDNLTSADEELRRNAAQMLRTEGRTVPEPMPGEGVA